ncbi:MULTISPECIES: imidazole glycerol phosphate synthase subunit HisH [Pseudomonas]|jgi:glutamine amidotransferase|uniref:Imidazole glycerol phosphate synthase subunit HisH n=2 Tax=Pseudomonas beijingensis TaxID=2954101 RepID=A0ABY9FHG4_9PSED|nr:imidazole glycerol phosphate synthase subunit HisH [Pseudomonas sp. FP2034]WLH02858.1 imidazole glycerol phosphate synthase subunit HisH [Pseudomonas sp. FP2034]
MNKRKISVINYGAGNIASVVNMIKHVGGEAEIISCPSDLSNVQKLLLPGVGAFGHAMECLRTGGWLAELNQAVLQRKVPTLGICLGMQLMCKSSEEGQEAGLGWIDARVRRFEFQDNVGRLKVPHMGWNAVSIVGEDSLVSSESLERRFYFVHSYYVECMNKSDEMFICNYGRDFVAGFHRENMWGVQFHPEKSHRFGMELFKQFLEV